MRKIDTDKDWEHFGKTDPYWAVMTNTRFHKRNLDDQAREEFFAAGERYVKWIFETILTHLDARFSPSNALDFGCGVGRLLLPLARRCGSVVGVDVSDSMIREAETNTRAQRLENVSLVRGDDELSRIGGNFDLINSYIVFQHIPCERGGYLLVKLLERLKVGGIGVLHFTYSKGMLEPDQLPTWAASGTRPSDGVKIGRLVHRLLEATESVYHTVTNALQLQKRSRTSEPEMQMNAYNLNAIFRTLQTAGIRSTYFEFIDHGGEYGIVLFFRKTQLR